MISGESCPLATCWSVQHKHGACQSYENCCPICNPFSLSLKRHLGVHGTPILSGVDVFIKVPQTVLCCWLEWPDCLDHIKNVCTWHTWGSCLWWGDYSNAMIWQLAIQISPRKCAAHLRQPPLMFMLPLMPRNPTRVVSLNDLMETDNVWLQLLTYTQRILSPLPDNPALIRSRQSKEGIRS